MKIDVKNVSKSFGRRRVLGDVCFAVASGEWIVLKGPNGAGKSTLLKIIAGAMKADSGEIVVYKDDRALGNREAMQERKRFGYLPQENPLFLELTVKDNIKFWLNNKEKEAELIASFGLESYLKSRVDTLSGGQKRKLAFYITIMQGAKVLLLDEPASALDMYVREELDGYLKEYVKQGGCIIMASHDAQEIALADRVVEIN